MLAGALAAMQRLQPFGVPVAGFFVVLPMLFVQSVSDRVSALDPWRIARQFMRFAITD
jgi:hypothetical protein